jgi:hypothetical protein
LFGFFKSLKRVMSGEVIATIDTDIMGGACVLSLRLKQDESSRYVVLAGLASGNYQFYQMDAGEFERFADAVHQMRRGLHGVVLAEQAPPDSPTERTLVKPSALGGLIWFVVMTALLFTVFFATNGSLGYWYILVVFLIGLIPPTFGWLYKRLTKAD